jgi:hypothetical protein
LNLIFCALRCACGCAPAFLFLFPPLIPLRVIRASET